MCTFLFFFYKQKTAYEMRISDWSSDVCSSDLRVALRSTHGHRHPVRPQHQTGASAMPPSIADKRATFRRLHESGCFVIPNPWDVGSALMLQKLGFAALASTSPGMAWARSEEHTAELQSLMRISSAVFCLTTKTPTSHKIIETIQS